MNGKNREGGKLLPARVNVVSIATPANDIGLVQNKDGTIFRPPNPKLSVLHLF